MRTSVFNLSAVIFPAGALQKALQSLLRVRKWLLQGSEEGRGMGPTGPWMGRELWIITHHSFNKINEVEPFQLRADCIGASWAFNVGSENWQAENWDINKNVSPWESCSLDNVSIVSVIFRRQQGIVGDLTLYGPRRHWRCSQNEEVAEKSIFCLETIKHVSGW